MYPQAHEPAASRLTVSYLTIGFRSAGCTMLLQAASSDVNALQSTSQLLDQVLKLLCDTSSSASLCPGADCARPSSEVSLLKGRASTTRLGRCRSRLAKLEHPQSCRDRRVTASSYRQEQSKHRQPGNAHPMITQVTRAATGAFKAASKEQQPVTCLPPAATVRPSEVR